MGWYSVIAGEGQRPSGTRRRRARVERWWAGARDGEISPLAEMLAGLVAFASAFGYGYRNY